MAMIIRDALSFQDKNQAYFVIHHITCIILRVCDTHDDSLYEGCNTFFSSFQEQKRRRPLRPFVFLFFLCSLQSLLMWKKGVWQARQKDFFIPPFAKDPVIMPTTTNSRVSCPKKIASLASSWFSAAARRD